MFALLLGLGCGEKAASNDSAEAELSCAGLDEESRRLIPGSLGPLTRALIRVLFLEHCSLAFNFSWLSNHSSLSQSTLAKLKTLVLLSSTKTLRRLLAMPRSLVA